MNFHEEQPNSIWDIVRHPDWDTVIAGGALPAEPCNAENNRMYCFGVISRFTWLTPSRLEDLRQAVTLLKTTQKQLTDATQAALCNFFLGLGLYQLGEYKEAEFYFKKAPPLEGEPTSRQLAAICHEASSRPKDRENFRIRTQKFWDAFAPEEANLRKMMNDAISSPKIWNRMCTRVRNLLTIAFRDPDWHWYEGETPMLQLKPRRSKCIALQQQFLFAHAPEGLPDRWDFEVGLRVPEDEDLEVMRGETEWLCDADVQVRPGDNGMLALEFYHPSLDLDDTSGKTIDRLLEALYQNIGEMVFLSLFTKVSLNSSPLKGHTIKLGYLLPTLEAMGCCDREDIRSLERRRHPFTRIPEDKTDGTQFRWRSDIFRGSSMDAVIGASYAESKDDTAQYFAGSGAIPGFVVFPLEGQKNSPALMRDLLAELDTSMDEELAVVLGEAEGLQFGYLDLLTWDLEPAMETVKDILRNHGLPWACWHSFLVRDRTVPLY